MRGSRVATRYAKSLVDLSSEQGQLDAVYEDMMLIKQAVRDCNDLLLMINSPIISSDKKAKVLEKVFEGKISEVTQKFVDILVTKKREHLVDDVAEEFERQYQLKKQIVSAEVVSARPLDDAQREEVLKLIKTLDDCPSVKLKEIVDPEIIGGLIVRVGDKQLDHSVAGRLEKYRQQFSKNHYIADF